MADFIIVAIILIMVVTAITYIKKEKKRGVKCIGCPNAGQCAKKAIAEGCNCGNNNQTK